MAVIKKVVATSGEEYQRLKEKANAYDAIVAEQTAAETELTEEITEESGSAGGGETDDK